jgi:hypothetical protein
MPDPISRLEVCQREVDRVFGSGHAATHPELVASVLLYSTIDQAAAVIAPALAAWAPGGGELRSADAGRTGQGGHIALRAVGACRRRGARRCRRNRFHERHYFALGFETVSGATLKVRLPISQLGALGKILIRLAEERRLHGDL